MLPTMKKIIGVALAVLLIAFALDIRVSHPHSGLKNALGSASSGIVVYKQSSDFAPGNKILFNSSDEAVSPVLAIVRTKNEGTLDVQSGLALERIEDSAAFGKLIVIIPFIGTIAQVLGL